MLRQLAEASLLPWCIIGDFNDLMSYAEKRDGRRNPHALIDGFLDIVMECGLHDLGFFVIGSRGKDLEGRIGGFKRD